MNRRTLFVLGLAVLCLQGAVFGQAKKKLPFHTPFDFKDSFYKKNGLDPKLFNTRLTPDDANAAKGKSKDKTRNKTRILEINGGYNAVGELLYYPAPPANFFDEAFLDNEKGDLAREVANEFRAFLFPKADGGLPLSPAPPNRRQDNLFDTSSGYLTDNPLGLWRITFPAYTAAATETPEGIAALAVLEERNGLDLDGTPILKRLSEIKDLEAQGFLVLNQRNEDGSDGFPWVV